VQRTRRDELERHDPEVLRAGLPDLAPILILVVGVAEADDVDVLPLAEDRPAEQIIRLPLGDLGEVEAGGLENATLEILDALGHD